MSTILPPYSVKAMHYSKNQDENETDKNLSKNNSFSLNFEEDLKNRLKEAGSKRSSITFKAEEEKNNCDVKKNNNDIFITPFHLNTDPQFKSTLPYLMIESFFLVIVMNINETAKEKKHYQFAVLSSLILLAHHIIMDTSVTYLSRWGKLSTTNLTLLMIYSVLTIISTLMVWIVGDYKANWVIPKTVIFFWCLFTYYTWQCMFIRMYEYRLTVINRKYDNENTIWRSSINKQKYYQKSL
ncbi:hypothetical protein BCR32DRAFT_327907 [Anaeromyces robustus]|uniref:Uncharacterized protein n=1 Tax=Anaeromyces robustus TaxID=1754192 RepID=A0A1Y1X2N8_9FUNG|nr:hypothetical protein BCR32DRAFT_327907 [Anaeromyces robustus]|eukprot:ORX79935.1 hypothetical protein BCR32DRAFT_327907 [Anaeromyces robustus]